ncbi:Zinc transporter, ZIP family [Mesoflavibacter sp. HG96]|uniref:ZIP family metal transporter n=1 Tax=unclassified Mesoflavibacter TaxID=2630131 RepID=UPI000D0FDC36|nr:MULTISPECIES: ZIP family metal transporter [unclassified Mesoflavibacter]QIJ90068.1 Zinc transporter, ZIP family [Mesoflavibacter sp. HG96]QIJ92796.1 Zinc transporter, ZIP family [Mesoflavibacter sp. HG37]
MLNIILPILSVVLGVVLVLIFKPNKSSNLKLLLAFSGAFLLSVTVFNFLPEVYHHNHDKPIGIFIMAGILLQIILEFFSKGAEHGHVHLDKNSVKFPWLLFVSLSIHSILEGIPIHAHDQLLYGIIIHKLPIAIILSTFFISSKIGVKKMVLFLGLFALMTPLGTYLSENFTFFTTYFYEISAIVIGIFLHISTTILFESNEGHKFNIVKLSTIVLAVIIAYFI